MKVSLIDHMGTDLSVVNAARVSFGKKKETIDEQDERLIAYLGKHKHISPFGHCFVSVHVTGPIFVARQLVKHKFLRWNEISRRYVDDEPEFYVPDVWRGHSADKKQGSEGVVDDINPLLMSDMAVSAAEDYKYLLSKGVCPEQARMVLPQSMMTEWYWSGSMDAFADMCNLRCKEDTQYETRQIANEIDSICSTLWPVSWKSLRH